MGRGEGKIATGRFRINMAGAGEGSSFTREVNNDLLNEGKLACSHRSCIGNNAFNKANDILHHYTVSLKPTDLIFFDTRTIMYSV